MGEIAPDVGSRRCRIHDLSVFQRRQIVDERGAVLHMLRKDAPFFERFGEIYFSEINPGVTKAWKRHREMTQHLIVPVGRIRLIVWDDREESPSKGRIDSLILGRPNDYCLVRVPPRLWYGFACIGRSAALLANCADRCHDPGEAESRPLGDPRMPKLFSGEDDIP